MTEAERSTEATPNDASTQPLAPQHLVIDAIEGDLARVEWHGRLLDLPLAWLPDSARPGQHLTVLHTHGTITFTPDPQANENATRENQAALDRLNAADDGGDLQL